MTGKEPAGDTAAVLRRPLLPGLYHTVPLGPDRVQVRNLGRTFVLSGPDMGERLPPLLEALDGRTSIDELQHRFPGLAAEVIGSLARRGIVVDADAQRPDTMTAAPGLAAIALPGAPWPAEASSRLRRATVVLAGCGPVASAAGLQLAKAGVGRLILCDPGEITPLDIAVSPVLPPAAAGRRRAEVTRSLCSESTESVCETMPDAASRTVLRSADLVAVEGRYRPEGVVPPEADAALAAGVPYLVHAQDALEAIIGPLVARGGRPCHRCHEVRRTSHIERIAEHEAYVHHRAAAAHDPDVFLAAHTALVAGVLATEILRSLLDAGPRSHRAALVIDLAALEVRSEAVLAVPWCPWCPSSPAPPGVEGDPA